MAKKKPARRIAKGKHPGKTKGRLSPMQRQYAKARGNGATMREAAAQAGLESVRALNGSTGCEWERDPLMQAAIEHYREQIPMEAVELNNRLAAKVRSVPATEMGRHELKAAEILGHHMGVRKKDVNLNLRRLPDLSALTDEELEQLDALMEKAHAGRASGTNEG